MTVESSAGPAELSALRHVAMLVAEGMEPDALFALVAEEVAHVVGVPIVGIARYESDDSATECASYSPDGPLRPLGRRWSLEGTSVLRLVRDTSAPVRIDDYSRLDGEVAETVRRSGIRASAASPIVVEGRLWGAMVASSLNALPADVEERLREFTELVGIAIANAESREALARLADEQSALRHVATLVARGVPPDKLFLAVSAEVRRVFGTEVAAVARFVPDVAAIEVIGLGSDAPERWELEDWMVTAHVRRSGRSARAESDAWSSAPGPTAARTRALGLVSTVASPIFVEGNRWGAILVGSTLGTLPLDTERRLEQFTELVATAISNTESRAELTASRRRIVAAADEARHRIERDLHDGTQQRLISLALSVRAAEGLVGNPDDLRPALAEVARGLADVVTDLQELSRGIHPSILTHGGLGPALRELAHRSTVPAALDVNVEERLAKQVEVATCFIVSEALANAAKHAGASRIEISARISRGVLRLVIRDDGLGGADATRGSGLTGLSDRVEALGGSIRVRSPSGKGTQIAVELPIAAS